MMIGDGRICYTNDQGKTWSEPVSLNTPIEYAIRLNSGKLGGITKGDFYTSTDEGKTWSKCGRIYTSNVPAAPYQNTLIQTQHGRLILPVRFCRGAAHEGISAVSTAKGTLNGRMVTIEGHAHFPEPDIAFVYYSDDEGFTWKKSDGGIMIWLVDGYGGMWPCDEPNVVELKDGSIAMYCRTTLGRIYVAHSIDASSIDAKGNQQAYVAGQRFDLPVPTELVASYSPCAIKRIPKTGDLLIIWNQVSAEEIRAGYRRGRLSSAISRDDGKTWKHFRTIDTAILPPLGQVMPDARPQLVRSLDYVGLLPKNYGNVDYPALSIVDEYVFISWGKSIKDPALRDDKHGRRLRRIPLSFLYQDEKPLPSGPKLLLQLPREDKKGSVTQELAGLYYEGTPFCSSKELAKYLKSPVGSMGKDFFGPVAQVVSCMGWKADIDTSHANDPENPYVLIKPSHPHVKPGN